MDNPYANLRQKLDRPLFVPFTVLGDPDKETSKHIVQTLIESGADALELGFPFSDPPADGPVIQAADTRALQSGITIDDCFEIIRELKIKNQEVSTVPVGLLTYFNLVLQRGIDRFYLDCKEVGVTSVLIADLPLEHFDEVADAAKANGIAPVFLISELTTDERMRAICEVADGYLYVVSYLGVTGVEDSVLGESVRETINRARKYTDLPLFVGFGINEPSQVRAVIQAGADGVIVGSRIVKEVPGLSRIKTVSDLLRKPLVKAKS